MITSTTKPDQKQALQETLELVRKVKETKRRRDAALGATERARKAIAARQQFVPVQRVRAKGKP